MRVASYSNGRGGYNVEVLADKSEVFPPFSSSSRCVLQVEDGAFLVRESGDGGARWVRRSNGLRINFGKSKLVKRRISRREVRFSFSKGCLKIVVPDAPVKVGRVLFVGESGPSKRPFPASATLPKLLRVGAFAGGRSAEFLQKLGFDVRYAINLQPFDSGKRWNHLSAVSVVDAIRADVESSFDAVVLCGRNVAAAFGLRDLGMFRRSGMYHLIPHPSGRSRTWNSLANRDKAREVARGLS